MFCLLSRHFYLHGGHGHRREMEVSLAPLAIVLRPFTPFETSEVASRLFF